MNVKTMQIIDHFTSDEDLKCKIMDIIKERKRPGTNLKVEHIVSSFCDDPVDAANITAKVKEIIQKVKNGHDIGAITGYHVSDSAQAHSARNNALGHRGVVEKILAS